VSRGSGVEVATIRTAYLSSPAVDAEVALARRSA
jgi:hypothetical protein